LKKVNPDWWKTLFDETYLTTDSRTICDQGLTCREVDFLEKVLGLKKSWPILDLCGGQGRHSLELARRGFKEVTVLDYAKPLIEIGRTTSREEDLNIRFECKDARETGLPDRMFRVIILMASSFGYFLDETQNEKILCEACRMLMPEGSLLLDLPNMEYVVDNFLPQSWHEANEDIIVCRQRKMDGNIIFSREIVISRINGQIRDAEYCTRLYSQEKITSMLESSGFDSISFQKDFVSHEQEADYGLMTNRMIVIAENSGCIQK